MKKYFLCLTIHLCLIHVVIGADSPSLHLVPTFENCSVYVKGATLGPDSLKIEYKAAESETWQEAHQLIVSSNDNEPRTSLFGLKAGQAYDVRCTTTEGKVIAQQKVTTWQDEVPILRTVYLHEENPEGKPYMIEAGGTPNGWIRYVGKEGYTIDGAKFDEEALWIENASYIILENVRIRGGIRHGIRVTNSNHIRIRNCDIAGFGRVGVQDLKRGGKYYMPNESRAINYDAGVYIEDSKQLVIERNYIHDPRNTANSWLYSHPAGPTAVFVKAFGEIVIRYNDFIGSDKHRWNDVIEGYGNGKMHGGFQRDSDIYGNYLCFANDDGIELDGAQRNVRFFGNKVEGMLCGISVAPNLRGPSFVYHNLVVNLGDERAYASAGVKNGGGSTYSKGRTYFYHNTFFTHGQGIKAVGFGKEKNKSRFLGYSRNNVFMTSGPGINDPWKDTNNNFDHEFFSNPLSGPGKHAISVNQPKHATMGNPGYRSPIQGDFNLVDDAAVKSTGTSVAGLGAYSSEETGVGVNATFSASAGLPWRHIPAVLDQRHITLRASDSTLDTVNHTVRLTGVNNSAPMPFTLVKNSAFDWLSVSATQSILAPNGHVDISVKLTDKAKGLQGPQHGVFLIQFPEGNRLSVTVVLDKVASMGFSQVTPLHGQPGAEAFETVEDTSTSSGKALLFKPDNMRKLGDKGVKVSITVPVAGKYNVYMRVRCPKPFGNHDSMFFGLNGAEPTISPISASENWIWTKVSKVSPLLDLKEGENILDIRPREMIYADAILVQAQSILTGEVVK